VTTYSRSTPSGSRLPKKGGSFIRLEQVSRSLRSVASSSPGVLKDRLRAGRPAGPKVDVAVIEGEQAPAVLKAGDAPHRYMAQRNLQQTMICT
jgi:hypothetical protein